MSNLQRVTNVFIGDGTALPASGSLITSANIANGVVDIAGVDMNTMASGATISDTESIYMVEGRLTSSSTQPVKRSMKIPGRKITSYLGTSYAPASRDVWAIGYNRQSAAGLITATNDATYTFHVRLKNPKFLYSERILAKALSFRSAAVATQLTIATQIKNAIDADLILSKHVETVVVGNGTGVMGLTAATAFGVEITAKLISVTQANSTYFQEERVYFDIELEDFDSAFGATTATQIENMTYGKNTFNQVKLSERKNISYEGVLNFTQFPIPIQTYAASSTLFSSSIVTATTGNVSITILEDVATVTSNTIIRPGEIVLIDTVQYEVKYLIGTTKFVVVGVASATFSGATFKVRYKYDAIVIEFSNPNQLEGAGVSQDNKQCVMIAIPSIDAGGAYTSQSAQLTSVLAKLNPYMASLGFANLVL